MAIQIKLQYTSDMASNYWKYRDYYKAYRNRPEIIKRRQENAKRRAKSPGFKERQNKNAALYYSRNRKQILDRLKWRRLHEPGFKEKASRNSLKVLRKIKATIYDALGNKCACCGETTPEFLTLDHIKGGGTKHRKALGGNNQMYYAIIKEGIPKSKYRLLCMNCNFSFGHWGRCPHGDKH